VDIFRAALSLSANSVRLPSSQVSPKSGKRKSLPKICSSLGYPNQEEGRGRANEIDTHRRVGNSAMENRERSSLAEDRLLERVWVWLVESGVREGEDLFGGVRFFR
jgi:hypothetical protein